MSNLRFADDVLMMASSVKNHQELLEDFKKVRKHMS